MKLFELTSTLPKNGEALAHDLAMDRALDYIKSHCAKSFDAMQSTGHLLLRGSPSMLALEKPFLGCSPTCRPPRDTKAKYQRAIDTKLKAAGFTALRSNSIYTVNSLNTASDYGYVYAIFPFDNCSYTWSTEHSDLTTSLALQTGRQADEDTIEDIMLPVTYAAQFVKKMGFVNGNLAGALAASGNREILVHGHYLGIPFTVNNSLIINNWINRRNDFPMQFVNKDKRWQIDNKDVLRGASDLPIGTHGPTAHKWGQFR